MATSSNNGNNREQKCDRKKEHRREQKNKTRIRKSRRRNRKRDRKEVKRQYQRRQAPVTGDNILCPYCQKAPKLVNGLTLYGRKDLADIAFYSCEPCKASVKCHLGTTHPMGVLANQNLRQLRNELHCRFDILWRQTADPKTARIKLYDKLAHLMGIQRDLCHIAMFTEDECFQALEIIENRFKVSP